MLIIEIQRQLLKEYAKSSKASQLENLERKLRRVEQNQQVCSEPRKKEANNYS